MASLPKIVIVGRMNVGKSTLFNRLSVDVKSITMDYEGVTRDVIKDEVEWGGRTFELIDTGGISLRKTNDIILEKVRMKALEMVEEASVIIFMCDAKVGIVAEDREISRLLHKLGKTVLLVVNKADSNLSQEFQHEFERLGHQQLFFISAQHGTGIADLLEAMVVALPASGKNTEAEAPTCRVVFLGKPNVGKSSLMNALLKEERSIVSDIPGTTREAISETITFYQEDIILTDTAGVRRRRSVDEPLESLMVKSTLTAVKETDIVVMMIDASQGTLADQELKLAFYAFNDQNKAIIMLFNKQDLLQDYAKEQLNSDLKKYDYLMKKVVRLDISCKTEKNLGRILPVIKEVWERYNFSIAKHELTKLLKEALIRREHFHKGERLQIFWARQLNKGPMTILLMVNESRWFKESQLSYFENVLRREYDLKGVPVRFVVRGGGDEEEK